VEQPVLVLEVLEVLEVLVVVVLLSSCARCSPSTLSHPAAETVAASASPTTVRLLITTPP
jgi:hypothetical protein